MTRTARLTTPGKLYQVVSYLRDGALLTVAEERARFMLLLGRALERSDWRCIGYCLESDQMRFAMIAGEQTMDRWARRAHGTFARWFNRRHGRRGPVFADRPCTLEVSNELVASLLAGMHDSSARAQTTADQSWSSRGAYLGLSPAPAWLDVREDLALVTVVDRQDVDASMSELSFPPFPAKRRARQDAIELRRPIAVASRLPQQDHSNHGSPGLAALLSSISERCAIPLEALQRRYGKGVVATAKRIAIHAAIESGVPIARMSAALGITRQRGSVIAQLELAADEALLMCEVVAAVRQRCRVFSVPRSALLAGCLNK